jgi:hypothetical protein
MPLKEPAERRRMATQETSDLAKRRDLLSERTASELDTN